MVELRRILLLCGIGVAWLPLSGCEHPGRLLVVVGTDYEVPREAGCVRIVVRGPDVTIPPIIHPLRATGSTPTALGEVEVPFSFVVGPRHGDSTRTIDIDVSVFATCDLATAEPPAPPLYGTTRRVKGFVRNETRVLPIHLSRACARVTGCSSFCEYGICSPREVIDPHDLPIGTTPRHEADFLDAQLPQDDAGGAADAGVPVDGGAYNPIVGSFASTESMQIADSRDDTGYFYIRVDEATHAGEVGRNSFPGAPRTAGGDYHWTHSLAATQGVALAVDPNAATDADVMVLVRDEAASAGSDGRLTSYRADGSPGATGPAVFPAPLTPRALAWGATYAVVASERSVIVAMPLSLMSLSNPINVEMGGVTTASTWAGTTRTAGTRDPVSLALHTMTSGAQSTMQLTRIVHAATPRNEPYALPLGTGSFFAADACLTEVDEPNGLWIVGDYVDTTREAKLVHRFYTGEVLSTRLGDSTMEPPTAASATSVQCMGTSGDETRLLLGGTFSGPDVVLFETALLHAYDRGAWFAQVRCAATLGTSPTCTVVDGSWLTVTSMTGDVSVMQIAFVAGRPVALVKVDASATMRIANDPSIHELSRSATGTHTVHVLRLPNPP